MGSKKTRSVLVASSILLVGVVAVLVWGRLNRYEILAISDARKFSQSNRTDLYVYYPHLVEELLERPGLAARVSTVHLVVNDFASSEFSPGRFSCLARLPNLNRIECTYSRNVDVLLPTWSLAGKLSELRLYNCAPIVKVLEEIDVSSLRSLQIHSGKALDIPSEVLESFANRMPACQLQFSND